MRRRHVQQPGPGRDGLDHQALSVHGDAGHPVAQRLQQPPRRPVAGVLDGHLLAARRQQDPRHDVHRLLGAVGDHDVLGAGLDPAGNADVPGDGLAQALVSGRLRVDADAGGGDPQHLGGQPAPGLVGEQVGVGDAVAKVELGFPLEGRRQLDGLPDRLRAQLAVDVLRPVAAARDVVADEGAHPDVGDDEPLGGEPVVGQGDGGARDAETVRQLARGRQAVPGEQPAVQDRATELPVDLHGQVLATDQADVKLHRGQWAHLRPDWSDELYQDWLSYRSRPAPRLGLSGARRDPEEG
jgi:hypothetical protein